MWAYEITTGYLYRNGVYVATGYAGHADGLNNPSLTSVPDVGPLPCGLYAIGVPSDHIGPWSMPLIPDPDNQMFGRYGFFIHGDEITHPGEHLASDGCIILDLATRQLVWE